MILNETELGSNNGTAQSQQDITLCKILIPTRQVAIIIISRVRERDKERER